MSAKSVLITGCSAGGIGASLAAEFQKNNYIVFATARNTTKIPSSLAELPNVHTLYLDVSKAESIAAAVMSVETVVEGKGLDVLVNNSGQGICGPALDADIAKAKALFEVNFWGPLQTLQAFQHLLVQARGTVVNISSIAGEVVDPYQSIYGASKAALTLASEAWRLELEPLGVKVVTVITGVIKSKWFEKASPLNLSEESYYLPIQDIIEEKNQGKYAQNGMDTDEFARRVVHDVVIGKTGRIWRGELSSRVRIACMLLPTWLMDMLMLGRGSGVKELTEAARNKP